MDARSALKNKNRDVFADLRDGEKILARSVISNGIYWKAAAILIVAILFLLVAYQLTLFFLFIAVLAFIYASIQKSIIVLVVTNQRVFIRAGILMIDTVQIRMERIESVEVQKTLIGYQMGYGTVIITGTGSQFAFIPFVENSAEIRNALDEILYQRDKHLQTTVTQTTFTQTPTDDNL